MNLFDIRRAISMDELQATEHPNIYKVDNFIYDLVYVNTDNGVIVNLFCEQDLNSAHIQRREELANDFIERKDYEAILNYTEGQYVMLCLELLLDLIPYKDRYDLFMKAYCRTDFNFGNAASNIDYFELLQGHRLNEEQIKQLDHLTDDSGYIEIYRAQGSKSTDLDMAISWTISKEVATRFAKVHNTSGDGIVLKAKVHIDDISDYITNRNEEEIIVNYLYLEDIKVIGG